MEIWEIIRMMLFRKPRKATIDFFAIFSVGVTVKFGEPFFFSMFHENSEIKPEK